MIQLHKTFFQFSKRMALGIILFSISNTVMGISSAWERVEVKTNQGSTGDALIYVSNTETNQPQYGKQSSVVVGSALFGAVTPYNIFLYADSTGLDAALWGGWFKNDVIQKGGYANIAIQVYPNNSNENPQADDQIYIAKWVKPQVKGEAVSLDFGTITAKTDEVTPQTAEYAITEYTSTEHFNVSPNAINNFSIKLSAVTEATADLKGTATISVDYTPTGIHGFKSDTAYIASALYEGDYKDTNSNLFSPIYFSIMEDYTPRFEVHNNQQDSAFLIGTVNLGDQEIISKQITNVVYDKNYAAKADYFKGEGQKQNTTSWKATIIEGNEIYENLFTIIDGENSETPTIQFNATRIDWNLNTNESKTLTAKLKLECTYNDFSSPAAEIPMAIGDEKIIYLSATVTQVNEATLCFGESPDKAIDSYSFGDQIIGGNAEVIIPIFKSRIDILQNPTIKEEEGSDDWKYFTVEQVDNSVKISIKKDESIPCGYINATVTITGTSALDHETRIEDTLNVSANMYLASPTVIAAGGDSTITFTWEPVFGATGYKVYESSNLLDANGNHVHENENITETYITTISDTQYVITGLDNEESRTFCFTAVNASSCESEKFGPVNATAELKLITQTNAKATGLKTGTKYQGGTGFPWHAIRDIDVSAAFDAQGNPLFDELHIFALSTGNTSDELETPCLKYKKDDSKKGYTKSNDIKEKNGNTTKDPIYTYKNITSNQKIYITGYRPYATTGTEEDQGVMYFQGGNVTLDLYLDNCEIYAQAKADNNITLDNSEDIPVTGYFARGSGSVFAFESTSTNNQNNGEYAFKVNIHIRGTNILDAAAGTKITANINDDVTLIDTQTTHYCSPISIVPSSENQIAMLTIDDNWDISGHTNGILKLLEEENDADEENNSNTSIDLGNGKTILCINGGQIYFQPIAACYKTVTYPVSSNGYNTELSAFGIQTTNTNYTNGNKTNDGSNIILKDGTINSTDTVTKFHTTILAVDGGTYNTSAKHVKEEIVQTDLYNSDAKKLSLFQITNTNEKYWNLTTTGIADLTESFPIMVDDLFPKAGVNITNALSNTGSYHYPLSLYYIDGRSYGHSSLTPKDNKIKLYLPKLNCDEIHHAWQICAPDFYLEALGRKYSIGGGENVKNECPEHPDKKYTTDYFMYMQSDQFVMGALGTTYFTPMNLGYGDIIIDSENDKINSSVSTADAYTINKKVYMLMPIEAAKWTLFAPPFDVANVYVIESYPENQLVKDYGGKRGKIPAQYVEAARGAQASRIVDLYAMWYFEGRGMESTSDFFADGTSDLDADGAPDLYGRFVSDWIKYEAETNYMQQEGGDYTPVIEKLIHFAGKNADYSAYGEGKNWLDANYYLYEQDPDSAWKFDKNHYTTSWDTVTIVADGTNAIMSKGQVYAIQFPFNSINGTHDPTTTWDYWTGKYLLIESTAGPHTINGSNFVTSALSAQNVSPGTASLFGNSTFAEIQATLPKLDEVTTTLWALEKKSAAEEGTERDIHEMVQQTTTTMAPTTGVLLANFKAPTGLIAKSINFTTGEITYEKINDPNTGDIETGIPTILGDATLLVEPTAEGLTITPLKEQHVILFDAEGKMIFSKYMSEEENVSLPTGVYVVRGEYEQVKAIKK